MTAWALSSATSGRRTSISSYRRMRQGTPSNGNRPADGSAGAEPKGNEASVAWAPRPALTRRSPEAARDGSSVGSRQTVDVSSRPSTSGGSAHQATSQTPRGGTLPASTILLIDADPAFAETISKALTSVGYSVTVSPDPAEALPKVSDHRLVIVDVIAGERTGVDVCREIRETPSMASIPVLCVGQTDDVEDRIRFLEAGADDVMARPFDARELEARVQALMLRFQRSKDIGAVISPDGVMVAQVRRTIAVHSPKGGVGTSTVATNIAMAAAQRKPDRVVVVDLDLQFGQVATYLNVEPRQTLADVVRDEA